MASNQSELWDIRKKTIRQAYVIFGFVSESWVVHYSKYIVNIYIHLMNNEPWFWHITALLLGHCWCDLDALVYASSVSIMMAIVLKKSEQLCLIAFIL